MNSGWNPEKTATPADISSLRAAAGDDPCLPVGLAAYENARADGLCHEGAWECAVAALSACLKPEMMDFNWRLQRLHDLVQTGMAG